MSTGRSNAKGPSRIARADPKWVFLLSTFLGAAATGIFFSSLNNFLADVYDLGADQRGLLETIRETPGMLLFLLMAPLSRVREGTVLTGALIIAAAGIIGTASLAPGVLWVTAWLFVWSVGAHMAMTLRESFCVALSDPGTRGRLFGLVRSLRSLGTIIGAACIWAGMGSMGLGYEQLYWVAAGLTVLSALTMVFLREPGHTGGGRKRFVLKKKYTLFYCLAVLFGVRKQIFLVFAPWVLIRIYDQDAPAMARLLFFSSLVGIFLKPCLGRLIDRFGERLVLMADSLLIMAICLCYGLAENNFPQAVILPCLFLCYVLDDSLFSLRSAHVTYLSKIVDHSDELMPSISTSYSIEHLVSMIAPLAAGYIWVRFGYPWVFFLSAAVGLLMLLTSSRIPPKAALTTPPAPSTAASPL
jgi:MFS family permease